MQADWTIAAHADTPSAAIDLCRIQWPTPFELTLAEARPTISLNLSFTLFKGGSRLAEGRIAKAERDEVRSAVAALRDSLESELENCWKRWLAEKSRVEYTKAQHQRSQEEFRLAELSYREGMLTYTDLELSQVALAETELRYLQSLYEWATATYSLETLTGSEFPEHV